MKSRIYLDYASLAPTDRRIAKLLSKLTKENIRNAGTLYKSGVYAKEILHNARAKTSQILGVIPKEIIFTSGGTESNNLAIFGVVNAYTGNNIPHIIVSAIEHPSVLECVEYLKKKKRISLTILPVDSNGLISIKDLKNFLKPETILVSVMYVNNEIGSIMPIEEIAKTIRHFKKSESRDPHARGVCPLFHTDACQAMNYLPTHIPKLGVDLLSFNSSKLYAGTGAGVLYIKSGTKIESIIKGGGQENSLRAGTENIEAYIAISQALIIAEESKYKESERLTNLKLYAVDELQKYFKDIIYNANPLNTAPHVLNVTLVGLDSEIAVLYLSARGFEVSAKSACKSGDSNPSHVLVAIGNSRGEGGIRISFGRDTKRKDIDTFIKSLKHIFDSFNKLSYK